MIISFVGAFYYDPDGTIFGTNSIRKDNSDDNIEGLGIAILYHKSKRANSNDGLGYWEYAMPNNPAQFSPIPEGIGWSNNAQLPKVHV